MADVHPEPDPSLPEPYLVCGEVRHRPVSAFYWLYTRHALAVARHLDAWVRQGVTWGPAPELVFQRDPPTRIRVPLAYFAADMWPDDDDSFHTVPTLVVEVLIGPDRYGDVWERLKEYRSAGVPVVWVVDPADRTVKATKPGQPPVLFNDTQTLAGDPDLPGFAAPVADFFR